MKSFFNRWYIASPERFLKIRYRTQKSYFIAPSIGSNNFGYFKVII